MKLELIVLFISILIELEADELTEQCSLESREQCSIGNNNADLYNKVFNTINQKIQNAVENFKPCGIDTKAVNDCDCYDDVITKDLQPYKGNSISKSRLDDAAKFGTRYQIINHRLYRDSDCMFPTRCSGIEHFLLQLLPELEDTELIVNTRDWPQVPTYHTMKGPVFSFSKPNEYLDIMYPAWTFWAGGPAISLHPTGIGRWDLQRESLAKMAIQFPWSKKQSVAFFRGSRTSDERDSLVLLSRRRPEIVQASYTKNQAWKSPKDTLNAEPANEVSFEDHCKYKFLFNFRGVAASFRFKHLFLCKSLVFHVGDEWNEFFYFALKPWIHYIPLKSYPSENEIEEILLFFSRHDDIAQKIAESGYEFIWKHLRMEEIQCYWSTLLKRYKSLLNFTVKLDEKLVEIKPKVKK